MCTHPIPKKKSNMKIKSKISYLGEEISILPWQMAEQLVVENWEKLQKVPFLKIIFCNIAPLGDQKKWSHMKFKSKTSQSSSVLNSAWFKLELKLD